MLPKFLAKPPSKGPLSPAQERIYAIGDIHGCADELQALLKLIETDHEKWLTRAARKKTPLPAIRENYRLVFLGDYVDRGPDSNGVIERLIDLGVERPNTIFLKGNHEEAMINFLDNPELYEDWLDWGGYETIDSYVGDNAHGRDLYGLHAALTEYLPHPHRLFLTNMPTSFENDDYIFVHAGLKPGIELRQQNQRDLLWIRDEFHQTPQELRPSKIVVHGHQPVRRAQDLGWRVNVDTGACWSGKLSAALVDGPRRRFLTT